MTPNETEKIKSKIRKLLALAASLNTNEANLALRRAQELMLKYNIDTSLDPEETKVLKEVYCPKVSFSTGLANQLSRIALTISSLFGCHATVNIVTGNTSIWGFKTNIELTKYALDAILAQGQRDYRVAYREARSVTFSQAFWSSFSDALFDKFNQLNTNTKGIILYNKVKEEIDKLGLRRISDPNTLSAREGYESGKNTVINPGIQSGNLGKLLS